MMDKDNRFGPEGRLVDSVSAVGPAIGTLADFHQAVYGKPLPEKGKIPVGLRLAVEKFRNPKKNYRLIWIARKQAWLAAEDATKYATRRAGLLAAAVLAARMGVTVDGEKR